MVVVPQQDEGSHVYRANVQCTSLCTGHIFHIQKQSMFGL